jgi:hypothetical protein
MTANISDTSHCTGVDWFIECPTGFIKPNWLVNWLDWETLFDWLTNWTRSIDLFDWARLINWLDWTICLFEWTGRISWFNCEIRSLTHWTQQTWFCDRTALINLLTNLTYEHWGTGLRLINGFDWTWLTDAWLINWTSFTDDWPLFWLIEWLTRLHKNRLTVLHCTRLIYW